MFKKVLGKAAAGTAAAGLILVPVAVTAAPQMATVACQYPDTVVTDTDVTLTNMIAPFGSPNTAEVAVTSGAGTPDGQLRISVPNAGVWGQRVSDGSASQALPRTLDAGATYTIRAAFNGFCKFRDSRDDIEYIVVKADVNVNPAVINGRAARFAAGFLGSGGLNPTTGKARFTVQKNGRTVRSTATAVTNGNASVDFADLAKGKYKLTVSYAGTSNYRFGTENRWFTVR